MPTRTPKSQPSRMSRRSTPAPQGRFGRPAQPARSGRPSLPGRRKPQQSTSAKALSALTGALGGSGSSKQRGGGKRRAGGMALLAGGLGLAMKNRSKLQGLLTRHDETPTTPQA